MKYVADFCKKWNMLPEGTLILCAVSGGRDSMALLHLLHSIADSGRFQVAAAHFNHQLRPAAGQDENFVQVYCQEAGIPLVCGREDIRGFAAKQGASLEDAARILRYRFLEETAGRLGAARIATAHHREDNAETVLLHLLRGSGLQGLCGIPPVRGRIVRPLLETSREEIDGYVAQHGIPYVEDESNQDVKFTRNRLRWEVLPLLEEICPGCAGRIAGTAGLLREENEHIARETERLLPDTADEEITLSPALLNSQDDAVGRRLVRGAGQRMGVELSRERVEALLRLDSGGYLSLPGGLCGFRHGNGLTLRRMAELPPPLELQVGEQNWGAWRVRVSRVRCCTECAEGVLALKADAGPLVMGAWDGKGRLTVDGGKRSIKRLFADRGIPVERRWEHPVLYLSGKPAAVFGVAVDEAYRPQEAGPCLAVALEAQHKV